MRYGTVAIVYLMECRFWGSAAYYNPEYEKDGFVMAAWEASMIHVFELVGGCLAIVLGSPLSSISLGHRRKGMMHTLWQCATFS